MKVLLTGANGFLGRYLLAALQSAGHTVVPAVRDPAQTDALLKRGASLKVDFNLDTREGDWLPRLSGIDAVINCAGILQGVAGQSIDAIHAKAPIALFGACLSAGVRRVIQISAVSVGAQTAYAKTKAEADTFLSASSLDWVVLRPSLVHASGAYGGTALFRALAALPFAIPVIGDGQQAFQPIHIDDLSAIILKVLATPEISQTTLGPVGPQIVTLKELLVDLRRWLGLAPAPVLCCPMAVVRLATWAGDVVGGPINSTASQQLAFGNVAPLAPLIEATGITPRSWDDALLAHPAQLQDRWHARLYFVRPLLRIAIAATWIGSAIAGLIDRATLNGAFAAFGVRITLPLIRLSCVLDLLLGIAVIARWKPSLIAMAQILVVSGYTVFLSMAAPALWLAPFGPLLKNLPFCAAVLALAVLERER